jgi:phage terminase Nu1 subunit (DNA packaging protein)
MSDIVGTKKLASILGKTERSIQLYVKDGILNNVGRGKFDLAQSVQRYMVYQLDLEKKRYRKTDLQINDIRKQRERIELEKAEIELGKIKGEIKEKYEVENAISNILSEFRNKHLEMRHSLSPKLLNKKSIGVINKVLKDWSYRILTDLAQRLSDVI